MTDPKQKRTDRNVCSTGCIVFASVFCEAPFPSVFAAFRRDTFPPKEGKDSLYGEGSSGLIYQAHYHKDWQGLMNQTPTMSEPQMSVIRMMGYGKPPFRPSSLRFDVTPFPQRRERIVGMERGVEA